MSAAFGEQPLKKVWAGGRVECGEVSGDHPGGEYLLVKLMETQGTYLCLWGGVNKGTGVPASTSFWDRAGPLSQPSSQTIQFSPLCPWHL